MYLKLFIQSLLAFLAIDSLWILKVASPWMKSATPHLMADKPNLPAAGVFYIIYLLALLFLIVVPGMEQKITFPQMAFRSFVFGLTAYATYDLTNLAVMKGFPVSMAVADMFWGGFLTMATALIVYKLNFVS